MGRGQGRRERERSGRLGGRRLKQDALILVLGVVFVVFGLGRLRLRLRGLYLAVLVLRLDRDLALVLFHRLGLGQLWTPLWPASRRWRRRRRHGNVAEIANDRLRAGPRRFGRLLLVFLLRLVDHEGSVVDEVESVHVEVLVDDVEWAVPEHLARVVRAGPIGLGRQRRRRCLRLEASDSYWPRKIRGTAVSTFGAKRFDALGLKRRRWQGRRSHGRGFRILGLSLAYLLGAPRRTLLAKQDDLTVSVLSCWATLGYGRLLFAFFLLFRFLKVNDCGGGIVAVAAIIDREDFLAAMGLEAIQLERAEQLLLTSRTNSSTRYG